MTASCSVCGTPSGDPEFSYGPIPLCDSYSDSAATAASAPKFDISVVRCTKCNHSELLEKPPEEIIYSDYTYFSRMSPDLDQHFTSYAKWMADTLDLPENPRHIDVGCNDGLLLCKSRDLGMEPFGIDPSPAVHEAAKLGLNVVEGYLNPSLVRQHNLTESADVITCNNMMANVRNLTEFGECLDAMLKPGGYLVVQTLHYGMLLQNRVYEMINHEHYHYFSVSSLNEFARRLGLDFVSVLHVPTKGASMRWVARKPVDGEHTTTQTSIDPLLQKPENKDVSGEFMGDLEAAKSRIKDLISSLDENTSVAGFGSSAGTTILTKLLDLEGKIDFLVDDNDSRHGFYSPGTAVEVVSPETYYEKAPALTINFAWRFAEMIAEKHGGKLPANHRFVMANSGEVL